MLLLFAGLELLRNALRPTIYLITGAMGLVTLLVDPTIGLVAGIVLYLAYWLITGRHKAPTKEW